MFINITLSLHLFYRYLPNALKEYEELKNVHKLKSIYHYAIYIFKQLIATQSVALSVSFSANKSTCHAHMLAQKQLEMCSIKDTSYNNKFVHFLPVCGTGWQKGYLFESYRQCVEI